MGSTFRYLVSTICILYFRLGIVDAQYGIGMVGSPCYTSGTCFGSSICQQNRCICGTGYQQMGTSCVSVSMGQTGIGGMTGIGMGGIGMNSIGGMGMGGMGMGMGGMGMGMGGMGMGMGGMGMGMGGMGGYGGGYGCQYGMQGCGMGGGIMPTYQTYTSMHMVYPGQACGGYNSCGYGSFCQEGICCCPTGYSQTGTGCIPGVGAYPTQMSSISITTYPGPGQTCGGFCTGGSICQQGFCSCPPNCIVTNNQCIFQSTMMSPMYNNYGMNSFGYGGGLGLGTSGGSQIMLTVSVGGFCQQSTMGQCVSGASCIQSSCRCTSGYYTQGTFCVRRRLRKDPKSENGEETKEDSVNIPPAVENQNNTVENTVYVNAISN